MLVLPLLLISQEWCFTSPRRQMSQLHVGEKVSGVVSHVAGGLALVDVGVEKEGVLPFSKLAPGSGEVSLGDLVEVWVSKVENEENLRRSSLVLTADATKIFNPFDRATWKELQDLEPGSWLRGFVVAQKAFGLLVSVQAPSSERGARAVGLVHETEVDGEHAIGSEVKVRILNIDLEEQRLVLSMRQERFSSLARALLPFQRAPDDEDATVRGRVVGRGKFGVFMEVAPADGTRPVVGLLPKASLPRPERLEQLTKGQELEGVVVRTSANLTVVDVGLQQFGTLLPKHMTERPVHVGDRVRVWVREVRTARARSLYLVMDPNKVFSLKSLGPTAKLKDFTEQRWHRAVVLRLSPFGAFVAVEADGQLGWAEGMVKSSQMVGRLELGQELKVRILDVDLQKQRMTLSMRSEATASPWARLALLSRLPEKFFDARVIAVEEKGCEVEVRHPQIGTVMGWLPESEIKGPKALELAQEIEVAIVELVPEKLQLKVSMPLMPRGISEKDFTALLADELGDEALELLREGDELDLHARVSPRGLELSLA